MERGTAISAQFGGGGGTRRLRRWREVDRRPYTWEAVSARAATARRRERNWDSFRQIVGKLARRCFISLSIYFCSHLNRRFYLILIVSCSFACQDGIGRDVWTMVVSDALRKMYRHAYTCGVRPWVSCNIRWSWIAGCWLTYCVLKLDF